jgi:hypothetical protein
MYTTISHELRHARKAWPGTPVDPCLLSGSDDQNGGLVGCSHRIGTVAFVVQTLFLDNRSWQS